MSGRGRLLFVAPIAAALALALLGLSGRPRATGQAPTPSPTPTPCTGFLCSAATTTPFPVHFDNLTEYYVARLPITLSVTAHPPTDAAVAYGWDWGDGSAPDTTATATHTYATPGDYAVTVAVKASPGGTASIMVTLHVQERRPPLLLMLPPGGAQTLTTAAHCPGLLYREGVGYIAASCGVGMPHAALLINDGDTTLTVTYDAQTENLTIATAPGYAVVATDLTGCGPTAADDSRVVCPPPVGGPLGRAQPLHLGSVPSGTYPLTVTYPAGWNLIGGVYVTLGAGVVDQPDPFGGYHALALPATVDAAWIYFAAPTTLALNPRGAQQTTINAPAGQWTLIGDPGQAPVRVEGAYAIETYDPDSNSYVAVSELQPGQGAWAYTSTGGPITLVPVEQDDATSAPPAE